MAYTKASMKAVDKYVKNNYDSFVFRLPRGRKAELEAYEKANGESQNGLLNRLVRAELGVEEKDWKKTKDKWLTDGVYNC